MNADINRLDKANPQTIIVWGFAHFIPLRNIEGYLIFFVRLFL